MTLLYAKERPTDAAEAPRPPHPMPDRLRRNVHGQLVGDGGPAAAPVVPPGARSPPRVRDLTSCFSSYVVSELALSSLLVFSPAARNGDTLRGSPTSLYPQ